MRILIAVLAAAVFTCGIAFAQEGSSTSTYSTTGSSGTQQMDQGTTGGTTGGATGEMKTVTATVKQANANQKSITVTGPKGNSVTYTLNNDTVITGASGQQITVGQLKSGSTVTINYTGSEENPTVKSVAVQSGQ
jgi:pectate lyase